MTAKNPLLDNRSPTLAFERMQPGDTRTVFSQDPKSHEITKTITILRTTREYVYDIRDAYNAALTRKDIEYYVNEMGALKLGWKDMAKGSPMFERNGQN